MDTDKFYLSDILINNNDKIKELKEAILLLEVSMKACQSGSGNGISRFYDLDYNIGRVISLVNELEIIKKI
jgi:hypothetical protein